MKMSPTKNEAINMAEHREGTRTWDLLLLFPGFQHFQYCYGQRTALLLLNQIKYRDLIYGSALNSKFKPSGCNIGQT